MRPLVRRVLEQAGLAPGAYRPQPLDRRVAACLRALKVSSEREALALLDADPSMWEVAAEALLIGVTGFFRDAEVFDAIRSTIVPALARRPRIRAWSAACSSGAELYSLAILLADAGVLRRAELLGTDCRRAALREAEAGYLPPVVAAGLDPAIRARHVEEADGGARLAVSLRRCMRWKAADILRGVEDGPWDIVLWRNSPMYLADHASAPVFAKLAGALAPRGYLVVGKAERPPAGLRLTAVSRCVYVNGGA